MSSSSDDEDFLMWQLISRKKKQRRFWVHPFNRNCSNLGDFKVSQYLHIDEEKFRSYYRMSQNTFQLILRLVAPSIRKKETNYRESISAEERLLIILRYLATGLSFRALSYMFMRGETTIGKIVYEGCNCIWNCLQPNYMKTPDTNDWINISKQFMERWNVPNCIGAIDGKHIRLRKPANSGSLYFNYKEFFSINLMACVDAEGLFTSIDVGDYGKNSDSGVFRNSGLGQALSSKTLNIPEPVPLPGEREFGRAFNFYFVVDEGFPLTTQIMRPYNQKVLNNDRRIFNYRLSRGRKIVECAFGMVVSKFRVFENPIACSVDKAVQIVKAACVLHNFIKMNEKCQINIQTQNTTASTAAVVNIIHQRQGRPSHDAAQNREYLCKYYRKSYGSVPWQDNYIV